VDTTQQSIIRARSFFFLLSSYRNGQPTEAMKFHRPKLASACSTAQ